MELVKSYQPETNCISEGQVLSEPYEYSKARIIVQEMTESFMLQLNSKGLVSDSFTLDIGYDRENCDKGTYKGATKVDHYGRMVPKPAHGSTRIANPTNLGSQFQEAIVGLFDRIVDRGLTVRRVTITANWVVEDRGIMQMDLFTDVSKLEKEKNLQNVMVKLKQKYGKNAVLKGTNFLEGATMRERNQQIGGHRAGEAENK